MKSFAARIRDALTREGGERADTGESRRAELTGLCLACGAITLMGGGNLRLAFRTEHAGTGRWIVRLLRRSFQVMPGLRILRASRLGGRTTYEIRLEGEDATRVISALGVSPMGHTIPKHCQKTRRSRDAFLRGIFLGCGTLSDPTRGYQMEFNIGGEAIAETLLRFLQKNYAAHANVHRRKGSSVVYIKDSEEIITVLSCVGAHAAILDMENVRITKDARNRANRAANCDSGNITKMLGAAERQLDAIAHIERTIGLDALPETLRQIAVARQQHEDLSLEALGEMLSPPVGKSGVYHRLSRIEAIARAITQKEKEEGL